MAHGPSHVRMGVTPGKPLGDTRSFVERFRALKFGKDAQEREVARPQYAHQGGAMKRLDDWFSDYGQSHRHPVNVAIHKVAVPNWREKSSSMASISSSLARSQASRSSVPYSVR